MKTIIFLFLGILACVYILIQPVPERDLLVKVNNLKTLLSFSGEVEEMNKQINKIKKIARDYNTPMCEDTLDAVAKTIYFACKERKKLDIDYICAVITHESALTWNPEIKSPVGAIGLMQIMPTTALLLLEEEYSYEEIKKYLTFPVKNVILGMSYLDALVNIHGLEGGLAGYNGGPRRALQYAYNKSLLPEETRNYVPSIMARYERLKRL
jgi:soluble lytic murein transglycosylase-like protein